MMIMMCSFFVLILCTWIGCSSFECFETPPGLDSCSNHGKCVGPNSCRCDEGYTGNECDVVSNFTCWSIPPEDPRVCSQHGKCVAQNDCQCTDTHYTGEDCSDWTCGLISRKKSYVCSNHGICEDYDVCNCSKYYTGPYCEEWTCWGIQKFVKTISCDSKDYGCQGAYMSRTYDYVKTSGVVTESCFPYTSGEGGVVPACPYKCIDQSENWNKTKHKIKSWRKLKDDQDAMEDLIQYGSFTAAWTGYQDFFNYKSGVYVHKSGSMVGEPLGKVQGYGVDSASGLKYWSLAFPC